MSEPIQKCVFSSLFVYPTPPPPSEASVGCLSLTALVQMKGI